MPYITRQIVFNYTENNLRSNGLIKAIIRQKRRIGKVKDDLKRIQRKALRDRMKQEGAFDGRFQQKGHKLKNKYSRSQKHRGNEVEAALEEFEDIENDLNYVEEVDDNSEEDGRNSKEEDSWIEGYLPLTRPYYDLQ